MRIAALARRAVRTVPGRAGVPPVWDRPDPPASAKPPIRTHRMTMEESHNYFFDAASPIYNIVNSEVAEGDLLQAFPNFARRLLIVFATGLAIGSVGFLYAIRPDIHLLTMYEARVDELSKFDKDLEKKYNLDDLKNNPWKFNAWPEFFPHINWGKLEKPFCYDSYSETLKTVRQVNSEGRAYWARLREESEKEIASGKGHH